MMWWFPIVAVGLVIGGGRSSQRWWTRRSFERFATPAPSRPPIRWKPRRTPDPLDSVAPTLDALARSVAGGIGLSGAIAALHTSAPHGFADRLVDAQVQHRLGVPLATALAESSRPGDPHEVAVALGAIGAAARHGGSQAAALDRAAVAVRQRRTVTAERRVQAAQARLSATVLVALPPVFALWNLLTSRRIARFMFTNPIGWVCTLLGVALDLVGWRWMRRLVGVDR